MKKNSIPTYNILFFVLFIITTMLLFGCSPKRPIVAKKKPLYIYELKKLVWYKNNKEVGIDL